MFFRYHYSFEENYAPLKEPFLLGLGNVMRRLRLGKFNQEFFRPSVNIYAERY